MRAMLLALIVPRFEFGGTQFVKVCESERPTILLRTFSKAGCNMDVDFQISLS